MQHNYLIGLLFSAKGKSSGGDSDLQLCAGPPIKSEFECGCCFTDFPVSESVACGDGHLFCQDCLKNYVRAVVGGHGKSLLPCLGSDCEALFSTSSLGFIQPKLMRNLEEMQQRDMLTMAFGDSRDEKLHHCPFCDYACLVPVSTQIFQCFGCGKESCLFCGVDWKKHADYGYVCDDVEGDDEAKIRLKTEEAMTEILARKCHRCSALILKESGCNKMTCKCGATMCYVCRKPDIGYDHFCQHTGGLGQPCPMPGCGKCSNIDETWCQSKSPAACSRSFYKLFCR